MTHIYETSDDSPADLMFTKDTLEISLGFPNGGHPEARTSEQFLILEFSYFWAYQKGLSMSFRDKKTYQEEMDTMYIHDYQTAVDNLHDIMELYPDCISAEEEARLLVKWQIFFTGLEESVFLYAENEEFLFCCSYCKDTTPEQGLLNFEFSYFPAVKSSPLKKDSIIVQEYTLCLRCGIIDGTKTMGSFSSFAYEGLDLIEQILAKKPFDYDDTSSLEEAAEFIRNKTNY